MILIWPHWAFLNSKVYSEIYRNTVGVPLFHTFQSRIRSYLAIQPGHLFCRHALRLLNFD